MNRFRPHCVLLIAAMLSAVSCSNEDMGDVRTYESDWCVVQGRGDQLNFQADDGDILKPTQSLDSSLFLSGDRYKVFYIPMGNVGTYTTVSGGILIEVENLQPVLVKDIVQADAFNSIANDPVGLNEKPFFGGDFLNFDFNFNYQNERIQHGIHLIQDSLVNRIWYLRFGHQANGDLPTLSTSALASFPVSSMQNRYLADSLVIFVLDDPNSPYGISLKDTI
jgi:hypothetical protein